MDHSQYYKHTEDYPLQSVDLSKASLLPQGWLFLAYSSTRDYAFYGIFKDYTKAREYMTEKEGYFGDWNNFNTYERIIMFDPDHPVLYWGYGDISPTYLVVWEFSSKLDTVTELLPDYDWSNYRQFNSEDSHPKLKIYDHTFSCEYYDHYVDGIDEDTYCHMILIGEDKLDAIKRSEGLIFKSVGGLEPDIIEEYLLNDEDYYDTPYDW